MSEFKQKYIITPRYLSTPSKRRPGRAMSPGVRFIVAHDTGNPGSTAGDNVRYYENSRNEQSASAHIFVDHREIIECIPVFTGPPEKAWHVIYGVPTDDKMFGHDANDAAIGVEYCYGGGIDADEAYRKYVWIMAYACFRFSLDPRQHIAGHFILDPNRKTDPVTGLARSRRNYEQLLRDVALEFDECTGAATGGNALPITRESGTVTATVRLNIRQGKPSTLAPIAQVLSVGDVLAYTGWTDAGDPVNGNSRWYQDGNGNFFWTGGVVKQG
ncbi:MAG: N-acetylmuramoyl-L-alanine amidase [Geobacter sp.]|nr:N-acetylmuramoyl-L-alanine amidase [Geobacter sp.]